MPSVRGLVQRWPERVKAWVEHQLIFHALFSDCLMQHVVSERAAHLGIRIPVLEDARVSTLVVLDSEIYFSMLRKMV